MQAETKKPEAKPEETAKVLPSTEGAEKIVKTNVYWAAGLGIIPIPLLDFATTTFINVKMLRELATYYGVEFRHGLAKSGITALLSGAASPLLSFGAVGPLVKLIPVVGQALGAIASPAVAGALTFAVGKVFTLHFATGGSLLDFDPEKFRDYFQTQIAEGRKAVEIRMHARHPAAASTAPPAGPVAATPAKAGTASS